MWLSALMFKDKRLRCTNSWHLLIVEDGKIKHKQSNHSMYCPCRKPEAPNRFDLPNADTNKPRNNDSFFY